MQFILNFQILLKADAAAGKSHTAHTNDSVFYSVSNEDQQLFSRFASFSFLKTVTLLKTLKPRSYMSTILKIRLYTVG